MDMDHIAGRHLRLQPAAAALPAACQWCAHEAAARALRARPHLRRSRQPYVRSVERRSGAVHRRGCLTVGDDGRHLLLTRRHLEARCCAPAQGRHMIYCGCCDARNARLCGLSLYTWPRS
eukprot:1607477-Prymnesium_polylepis.1